MLSNSRVKDLDKALDRAWPSPAETEFSWNLLDVYNPGKMFWEGDAILIIKGYTEQTYSSKSI